MIPFALIIDDFLEDMKRWRNWALTAEFKDHINPIEGVSYPLICAPLPPPLIEEVAAKLAGVLGVKAVTKDFMFMRRSDVGTPVQNQVHSDASMAHWTLILYMNEPDQCQGGTRIMRHKQTGLAFHPPTPDLDEVWRRDSNTDDAWESVVFCPMVENRAFIYQADLLHRAEPLGGFGHGPLDGRLVLSSFFSLL